MRELLDHVIPRVVARARARGRDLLLETEAHALVEALGMTAPSLVFLSDAEDLVQIDLEQFPGDRVVIKVVSADLLHKSRAGGVSVVAKRRGPILEAIRAMERRFQGRHLLGFDLHEYVEHDTAPGGELLLGMRWTREFGPVVTLGLGGIHANFLSELASPGKDLACFLPGVSSTAEIESVLSSKPFMEAVFEDGGSGHERPDPGIVRDLVMKMLDFAARPAFAVIGDFEINPLVFRGNRPVALDALVKLAGQPDDPMPTRPREGLRALLRPDSMAIVGVSQRRNPGRILLENTLRAGFDPTRIFLVKPGHDELLGCRCVAELGELPEPVDLLVLAIGAEQVPGLVEEAAAGRLARSVIVIPGGLGERRGSEGLVRELRASLRRARIREDRGPVVNGANCLGIRSVPGRYDTMFIPHYKLPAQEGPVAPVAILAQSGAFAVSRASKLVGMNPRYLVSTGNQVDLTMGDYLQFLKDDPETRVFACYVEGFEPLDGKRWLQAARKIVASGRAVILYRAGRTPSGHEASASHTASVAGDYPVTRELAEAAGVVMAESLADFEDLIRLFVKLDDKRVRGWRLGALSNAGFECVAIADAAGRFRLPELDPETVAKLQSLYRNCRLEAIVEARNPADLTPIMDDAHLAAAAQAVLEDPQIDVGIVGCVPLTGACRTLPASGEHQEDLAAEGAVAGRLARLKGSCTKPWIAVVDAGPLYDPLAQHLDRAGVPVFRTADRALRLLEQFCAARMF